MKDTCFGDNNPLHMHLSIKEKLSFRSLLKKHPLKLSGHATICRYVPAHVQTFKTKRHRQKKTVVFSPLVSEMQEAIELHGETQPHLPAGNLGSYEVEVSQKAV